VNTYGVISWCGFLQPLAPSCGSFLPVLNPVVIRGLRAGTCCAVLRGSLYVCIILRNSVRLSCWIKKRLLLLLLLLLLLYCTVCSDL